MSTVEKWNLYIGYLKDWIKLYADPVFAGISPASYDEWCDCEEVENEE